MQVGDSIQVSLTINGIPMSLPGIIMTDLGNQWEVEVQYSDGTTNKPLVKVNK